MRKTLVAIAAAFTLLAAGCGSQGTGGGGGSSPAADPSSSEATTRTVEHAKGTAEIPAKPQRIVSTSVTLTGTLLAIDAPVVGSGGSKPNGPGLDANGWFTHWSKIAEERGVESLYTGSNLDIETITAAKPDVIIVAATGNDSAVDSYDQLNQIAPTLVVDYNSHDWEEVTRQVGQMLNLSENADKILTEFDAFSTEAKDKIKAPTSPVDIAVYNGEKGMSVGLPTAPQALILKKLGIDVADTGVEPEKGRKDFAFTSPEQAVTYLKSEQMLLVGNEQQQVDALLQDERFATIPSVQSKQVKPLGQASFKLDYYSARDLVEHAVAAYSA